MPFFLRYKKWIFISLVIPLSFIFLNFFLFYNSSQIFLSFSSIKLSILWALPFAALLLSLCSLPLIVPFVWHHHYGKIVSFYSFCSLFSFWLMTDTLSMLHTFLEIICHDYLPFLLLISALYVTSGGIQIEIQGLPSAKLNTLILLIATLTAGWIGTTGASIVFIRPFLDLNKNRNQQQHLVIFFIILVGNIGGVLTPLGDPPLFLGYLQGVGFFWPLKNLILPMILMIIPLLLLFYIWDHRFFSKTEKKSILATKITLKGYKNIAYLVCIIGIILGTSTSFNQISFTFLSLNWSLKALIRDLSLCFIIFLSYFKTDPLLRQINHFSWDPLKEVSILFAAIFMTAAPVLEMMKQGMNGPLKDWLMIIHQENGMPSALHYFWASGLLSSFLDNAPTYLVFFNMAGSDPWILMNQHHLILKAISAGAVFMGALTYIGNAPNFMIKSIAESYQIKMPSFLNYTIKASILLIPLFGLLSLFFFL